MSSFLKIQTFFFATPYLLVNNIKIQPFVQPLPLFPIPLKLYTISDTKLADIPIIYGVIDKIPEDLSL